MANVSSTHPTKSNNRCTMSTSPPPVSLRLRSHPPRPHPSRPPISRASISISCARIVHTSRSGSWSLPGSTSGGRRADGRGGMGDRSSSPDGAYPLPPPPPALPPPTTRPNARPQLEIIRLPLPLPLPLRLVPGRERVVAAWREGEEPLSVESAAASDKEERRRVGGGGGVVLSPV